MLVSAVVRRKIAVVPGNLCEANIPPTTISPLPIATRVMMTCKSVKAPTDIPRIMESPVIGLYPRNHDSPQSHFDQLMCAHFMDRSGACLLKPGRPLWVHPRRPRPPAMSGPAPRADIPRSDAMGHLLP